MTPSVSRSPIQRLRAFNTTTQHVVEAPQRFVREACAVDKLYPQTDLRLVPPQDRRTQVAKASVWANAYVGAKRGDTFSQWLALPVALPVSLACSAAQCVIGAAGGFVGSRAGGRNGGEWGREVGRILSLPLAAARQVVEVVLTVTITVPSRAAGACIGAAVGALRAAKVGCAAEQALRHLPPNAITDVAEFEAADHQLTLVLKDMQHVEEAVRKNMEMYRKSPGGRLRLAQNLRLICDKYAELDRRLEAVADTYARHDTEGWLRLRDDYAKLKDMSCLYLFYPPMPLDYVEAHAETLMKAQATLARSYEAARFFHQQQTKSLQNTPWKAA